MTIFVTLDCPLDSVQSGWTAFTILAMFYLNCKILIVHCIHVYMYRETSPLLLLRCRPGPLPGRLSPVGWIIGQQSTERPNCIQFQQVTLFLVFLPSLNSIPMLQAGAAMGAILSIGWSSGRLQQLPLVFGGPDSEGEIWSQHPDPTLNLFSVLD